MERVYSLTGIIDNILDQYAAVGPKDKDNLRKMIEKICKGIPVGDTNLWAASAVLKEGGKKIRHKFTQDERQRLLYSDELQKYILKHVSAAEYEEYIEAEKEAQRSYEATLEDLRTRDEFQIEKETKPSRHEPDIELEERKKSLMLEALYLKFFEPIDEELLAYDLANEATLTGLDITAQAVLSQKHLALGPAFYCKERKENEDDF